MQIGLLGLTLNSGNKGCEALAYGFLNILNEIGEKEKIKIRVYFILPFRPKSYMKYKAYRIAGKELDGLEKMYTNLSVRLIVYQQVYGRFVFSRTINCLNGVFDFTAGDSFTDLYGKDRFYSRTILKEEIINRNIPFILGSQTIGPFQDEAVRKKAVKVILNSKEVFVRDEKSMEYTKKISGRVPKLTTDVAFALPYDSSKKMTKKVKVGFNPSGLLWNESISLGNKFDLKTDYCTYCREVIRFLLSHENMEVYLVQHAAMEDLNFPDNDRISVLALKEEFPKTIVSPLFKTAMEAKTYIASMDIFLGARMHATIAAFSATVPVIPFSYSRKFEGLFQSLGYEYIISGRAETTENAIETTRLWLENIDELRECIEKSSKIVNERMDNLKKETLSVLRGL